MRVQQANRDWSVLETISPPSKTRAQQANSSLQQWLVGF